MAFTKITTMKKLLIVLLFFTSAIAFGQEKSAWHINFEKAAQISLQTGKPILANFTGSDWCGWCKKLKKEVFDKKDFKTWATENVVLLELDYPRRVPQSEEIKKQNRELQQVFQVRGYPTIHLFNVKVNNQQLEFIPLAQTGYVAGGPGPWIAKTQSLINQK